MADMPFYNQLSRDFIHHQSLTPLQSNLYRTKNRRRVQRYITPRDKIGPDGRAPSNVIEVTVDQLKAGLPLKDDKRMTVEDNYSYGSQVVAMGSILLAYPKCLGQGPGADESLGPWYTDKCFNGWTFE